MNSFDPAKEAINKAKHGVSLADADQLDWDAALVWVMTAKTMAKLAISLTPMGNRLYYCAYVERDGGKRIISLRKANKREVMEYAGND
jgi:uncharacterized DUF497 family protein